MKGWMVLGIGLAAVAVCVPVSAHMAIDAEIDVDRHPRELIADYRHTGDDRYLTGALAKLARPDGIEEWTLRAWALQAAHNFEQAERIARNLLMVNPRLGALHTLVSSLALVQGRYEDAERACAQGAPYVAPLVTAACQVRIKHARGDLTAADFSALKALLEVGEVGPEVRAWAEAVAGEAAMSLGDLSLAQLLLRSSVARNPTVQAKASLIDVLLRAGSADDALAVALPHHGAPSLRVRELIARRELREDVDREVARLDRAFAELVREGDLLHAREMVMFYLDVLPKPELAVELAAANVERQREPEDLLLLKRAHLATGGQP